VITPSAARGIIEAIYWKPQIRWVVDRLRVLQPLRFTSLRRNEVGAKINAGPASTAMKSGSGNLRLFIEEERQQRAALILRDVAYIIEAHFDVIGGEDNIAKHLDQFNRRARDGQCFTRPYLGCREFAANFALVEKQYEPEDKLPSGHRDRDLGWMLHDIDFQAGRTPRFFHAKMVGGTIEVPLIHSQAVRA
jgi:CRISPR-associated protein Cas5d